MAAIVVSGVQLFESHQQNQIIELQTKIAEAHELPVFDFKQTKAKDGSDQLTIENVGGALVEFDAIPSYSIRVSATTPSSPFWTTITIHVNDYYPDPHYTRDAKGTLANLDNPNAKKINDAMSDLQAHHPPFDKIIPAHETDLKLKYTDFLGRPRVNYFQVTNEDGAVETTAFNTLAESEGFKPDYDYEVPASQITSKNILEWLQEPTKRPDTAPK